MSKLTSKLGFIIFTIISIKASSLLAFSNNNVYFSCQQRDGHPSVVVRFPGQEHQIVNFSRLYDSSRASIVVRYQEICDTVALNFQRAYYEGARYVTSGQDESRRPIICATTQDGGACEITLFRLNPRENASLVLQNLFDMNTLRPGRPIEQNRQIHIHFNELLKLPD
jgi:hypothetical protein